MTPFAVMRHAPTDWNASGRLQGRSDPPLSAAGRAMAAGWHLPPDVTGFRWLASPLCRATETAASLKLQPTPEPDLIEMA